MLQLRIYDLFEKISQTVVGPSLRTIGKQIFQAGLSVQGNLASDDRLVPSLRCKSHDGVAPTLNDNDFIAPNSTIVGNVKLGSNSSVWYGAVLRGEIAPITVGRNTIIQDLATIIPRDSGSAVNIGDNVFIGPNSRIGSCTIEQNGFVGMGSTVRHQSTVQGFGVVAAGAVIPEGAQVGSNQIWAGNPAQYLRDLTPEEKQVIQEHHQEITQLAQIHSEETEKSFREIINDRDENSEDSLNDFEAKAMQKMRDLGFPTQFEDQDFIEQRIFLQDPTWQKESEFFKQHYDPYEQDLSNYPDSFKQYGENFSQYEQIKKHFEQNPTATYKNHTKDESEPTRTEPWNRRF